MPAQRKPRAGSRERRPAEDDRPAEDGTLGRITRVSGPMVEIEGLWEAALLDLAEVGPLRIPCEITAVREGVVTAQVYEYTGGLGPGTTVRSTRRPFLAALGPWLLGGIFDGLLRPLEGGSDFLGPGTSKLGPPESGVWRFVPGASQGASMGSGDLLGTVPGGGLEHRVLVPPNVEGELTWISEEGDRAVTEPIARIGSASVGLGESWPIRRPRPVRERLPGEVPLVTGQRVVDLLYPLARGSTAAVPGGFGTGKTILLQQIAKWCDADVIVYVGCGERGNEMAEVLGELPSLEDPRSGRSLMDRTVIIANTSNMPVMARESSIYTGITVAEYYRDMGHDAVVIADSTSRWAQALREFSSRIGELPAEEGYPASLASALAAFYERAGRVRTLGGTEASVTVIGAVSPPGGDKTEPVTSHTSRFVRCLWSLNAELAAGRHYPAVSWRESFSRDAEAIAAWHVAQGDVRWAGDRSRAMSILSEADRLEAVAQLVGVQALPGRERVLLLVARLLRESVLQQNALNPNDAFASPSKQSALVQMVLAIYERCTSLIENGVPASLIEELDYSDVFGAREHTAPDAADGIAEIRDEMLHRLEGLR
jgi:V/A-type H+-transporting ATPase subunit A